MPAFSENDPLNIRLELESVPTGSPASEVARQLVALLTAGDLAPGSRLPSERVLAERLGVGRSAVREALAALEILGIVQIRPGSGTYLRGGTSDLLPTTLSWGLMLASNRTRELLEIRSSLERTAAILAVQRASDEELDALGATLDQQAAALDDPPVFIEADVRFHILLARAGDNDVLADLLQSLRSMLSVWVGRRVTTREATEAAYREHREVYDAMRARDVAATQRAMDAHMATASARIEHADPVPAE
ncbi:GntR family transcriptional repressor for pyruvate dehydrogenase complex [Curtobacterium sp. PhB130]|uniref:FadR/GntR family transcriptional regulator n=1 Tax=unclassified Curtobacterium TaxID=257496 RepID=UPI000F4BD440|nr:MULTISPECIES: FadR/GntR family transcriptional regulator [unclassified Curtobacterium]ROP58528.1 GntR family transcriptional repressor for pyruvate dehydrogenase complex [Curtobacterium sp. ZW137]ROS74623.1 GntR family transcriptional repressor for pyruvate dehydrogenase complex [Curtobacterium sp. PhB130]TCK59298.1 GntR family transcriptional repressor for pyruvate dehydrogenase complex [Curtobacterium sp. PhB136]